MKLVKIISLLPEDVTIVFDVMGKTVYENVSRETLIQKYSQFKVIKMVNEHQRIYLYLER